MFAGIVEAPCPVVAARRSGPAGAMRLEVELGDLAEGLEPGASVAVNGVCLTLVACRNRIAAFDVVPETLRRTNLGALRTHDRVNIERALRVGDAIDGHFVQGHVDGVGRVAAVHHQGAEYVLWTALDESLMPCVVRKGSVAIDGVSLTVVDVEPTRFSVALIPTTLERTVLGERRVGDPLNIETDVLARIIVQRLDTLLREQPLAGGGLTYERLRETGFLP